LVLTYLLTHSFAAIMTVTVVQAACYKKQCHARQFVTNIHNSTKFVIIFVGGANMTLGL